MLPVGSDHPTAASCLPDRSADAGAPLGCSSRRVHIKVRSSGTGSLLCRLIQLMNRICHVPVPQFFRRCRGLCEAARLDGAVLSSLLGHPAAAVESTHRRVAAPFIFAEQYLWPLLSPHRRHADRGACLKKPFRIGHRADWNLAMAAAFFVMLPPDRTSRCRGCSQRYRDQGSRLLLKKGMIKVQICGHAAAGMLARERPEGVRKVLDLPWIS